jgi:outer membrane protein OmpA-like peptidoglycan-associated protein
MKSIFNPSLAATVCATAAAITLAGCASAPKRNEMLEQARAATAAAERSPQLIGDARADLTTAQQALKSGDELLKAGKPVAQVDHQAYIAQRFAMAAQKGAELRASEAATADAGNRRNKVLLNAREQDAARATAEAKDKGAQADAAKAQADSARAQADSARAQAEVAKASAEDSARTAEANAREAAMAQQRSRELEAAMADLQAKKTDQGMVITLGDVLFSTGQATLKSGSRQSLDKLSKFLNQYTDRKVRIEGYTDSVGSESSNQALSERRAGAVRDALTDAGIANNRIQVRGYGEESPVAGNESSGGRQQNRRVEVIILDNDNVTAQTNARP